MPLQFVMQTVLGFVMITRGSVGASMATAADDTARYTLRFAADGRSADVSAEVTTADSLIVRQGAADDLPLGWVTFIRNLQVRNAGASTPLTAVPDSAHGWILPLSARSRVMLHYQVNLAYAHSSWPPGNEQGGEWENGSLYSVTKPLFVTGPRQGPAIVSIQVPAGWRVATPWKPHGSTPNTYLAEDGEDLVNNSLVVGNFSAIRLRQGPFDFTIALLGEMRKDSSLIARTIPAVAEQYARIFDRMPATTYLMTLFYGTEDDGESFQRSSAFRTHDRITVDNTILWANTLAHELFHYWNGGMIDGADDIEKQWFVEGVTEYYANRSLLRARAITRDAFLKKAEVMAGLYTYFRTQPMFDSISVLKSGERKTRYRFGVYNGGWSVAFALDQELRAATSDRRGLDDVMRDLFDKFGVSGRKYREVDIERAASSVAQRDESAFFAKYVRGLGLIPMDSILRNVGLNATFISYAGEAYIRPLPRPSRQQTSAWRALSTPPAR